MSHHYENGPLFNDEHKDAEIDWLMENLRKEQEKIDGKYPHGKLSDNDQGALAYMVGTVAGRVVMNFAKQTQSVGLTADDAMRLAESLIRHAGYIKRKTITISNVLDRQGEGG